MKLNLLGWEHKESQYCQKISTTPIMAMLSIWKVNITKKPIAVMGS